ncbi:3'(2'),5'-bisphosphate nucleotidase CysQ [Pseudodesulfovibrio sediminis]|uniref:3'(2'),5'-bisphosphate nucleotidase CysQ n=1 Tax=Pseudodesulfovibrio sediminis TaxID=2810563 RepID=A0ABN6ET57_9BACT|nr:3'(2'),5'-bisphosphate nucleotidase CysQ [Pseudodesulfovibrio sediminis]BCS88241.1 3'(2'),5'-bisphosphate nucleotidase CysQ [Pseudodesulfovibrio sediminis]
MIESEVLKDIVPIAVEAGERIMQIYDTDFEVDYKADQSPLTEADKASHEHIVARLEALFPDTPVLSEESTDIPWSTRKEWTEYWLIDPLDGTKEFVNRNGEFTVNIALIREGVSVMGIVYAPVLDICWFAAEGNGALCQKGDGAPERIHASQPMDYAGLKIVGSRSHQSDAIKQFMSHLSDPELVPMGSSLKLCAVADGTADIYPRLGLTSEWDTAAAHCVVTEAGGVIVEGSGVALGYNGKESILNPFFLVLGGADDQWRSDVTQWFGDAAAQ